MLEASTFYVQTSPRAYLDDHTGVYVIRPGHPEDVVESWNMRTYGTNITGVPAAGAEKPLAFLLSSALPGIETRAGGGNASPERVVRVWGLEDASDATLMAINAAARGTARHTRRDTRAATMPARKRQPDVKGYTKHRVRNTLTGPKHLKVLVLGRARDAPTGYNYPGPMGGRR